MTIQDFKEDSKLRKHLAALLADPVFVGAVQAQRADYALLVIPNDAPEIVSVRVLERRVGWEQLLTRLARMCEAPAKQVREDLVTFGTAHDASVFDQSTAA